MSLHWPIGGSNFTPAYQISGIPFVTSSVDNELTNAGNVVRIEFPFITSTIRIEASGSTSGTANSAIIRYGFTENGVNSNPNANYGFVNTNGGTNYSTPDMPIRCKELFLRWDAGTNRTAVGFTVVAGLTNIPSSNFPTLTGSINGVDIPMHEGVG